MADPVTPAPPAPIVPTPVVPIPVVPTPVVTTDDDSDDADDSTVDWKQMARKHERRAKELAAKQAESDAQLEALRTAAMSEQERAIATARSEERAAATAELTDKTNARLFRAELRAAVAGKLNDAAIADLLLDADYALKLLSFDRIPLDAGGDIDVREITRAVGEYVTARPHLAASAAQAASITQGARARTDDTSMDAWLRQRARS